MSQAQGRLDALEQQIATSDDPALWLEFANGLFQQKHYAKSAQAYAHILSQDPYHRRAQFQRALALAQAELSDDLHSYMEALTYEQALLANEIFSRAELKAFLHEERFQHLAHEARVQAVD